MFNIKDLTMDVQPGDGITKIVVQPDNMYPVIITRIQEVLAGANPNELLATAERGGSARADVLIQNARALPEQAWQDALTPRSEFTVLPYGAFVERNGQARQDMITVLSPATQADVIRMIQRGYALEIAYGWFCQAVRLEYGSYDLTIDRDEDYKL
jgi:hypothetical protein